MRVPAKIYLIFPVLILMLLQHPASGQEMRVYDFCFVRDISPWLTSGNYAGLGTLPTDRIAAAEVFFNKSDGGLAGIEESGDSWKAGAYTESNVRISDRIAFCGKLSYTNFRGKDMGGPVLMNPSYNPVNFLESTDTTAGMKTKELYLLRGGISYSFSEKWSIGAGISYEAGNYAKRKDPRFLNSWMDMDVSAGVRFAPSDRFSAGLDLEYRKTVESVYGDIYGTSNNMYYILVDYGGYFGYREQFDGDNGMVSTSGARPMFNSFMGGSLQLDFKGRGELRFFNEFTYLRRSGYYGNRGSGSVVRTEHSGNTVSWRGIILFGGNAAMHRLTLSGDFSTLDNFRNNYSESTVPGESTEVVYHGRTRTLDRSDFSAEAIYRGYFGVRDNYPEWEAGAGIHAEGRYFTASSYPFFRRQDVTAFRCGIFIKKNFLKGKNIISAGAEAGFMKGFGTAAEDGEYVSSTSPSPWSGDSYLLRDFEFRTAARLGGGLSLRYTRILRNNLGIYAGVRDRLDHTLAPAAALQSGFRNVLEISAGCTF